MSFFDQSAYAVRCEWGLAGVQALAPHSDVMIIVDVLSFCTCVDIAVTNGAQVYPYHTRGDDAVLVAQSLHAVLAQPRGAEGFSLSPASLLRIPQKTRLVLPSPNGATLSLAAAPTVTFAACLRNARAVAYAAMQWGERIAVIAAGERWSDGSLRPALEDWLGAGAVIAALKGERSPEAAAAEQTFQALRATLPTVLQGCASGRELIEEGFGEDVQLAAAYNASGAAPRLIDGAYQHPQG